MSIFESSVPQYKDWQVPVAASSEDKKLGWLNESCEEGLAWLKSQRGSQDFLRAFRTIGGQDHDLPPAEYRSRLNPNPLKTDIREIVGSMAKLRPMWGYHSDNHAYDSNAQMMNLATRAIYLEQGYDRSIKGALAWAAATCKGYVRPRYRRTFGGTGEGNVILDDYGSASILPLQLPRNGDIQGAYAITILDEIPIFEAHAMFPLFQSRLRPSQARYWYANDAIRRASQGNWLRRAFGSLKRKGDAYEQTDLLIPIRYTYIMDLAINSTDHELSMGDVNASWHYKVPHLNQQIPVGFDPVKKEIVSRRANETDARIYPRRRLMISTDTVMMYDGTAFDWHGMVPLVPFGMDSWPWEPLGFSLVHDGYEINESIKRLERAFMDKQLAKADPALAYDQNATPVADARSVDPYMPRGRYGYDGNASEGAPYVPILPKEYLTVDAGDLAHLEHLYQTLHGQTAVQDAFALAKLRIMGPGDFEKAIEANGPIIEDMSRDMEPSIRNLGVMIKYNVLQYMTTARVMQYVGADNMPPEIFDYDPSSIVPSHLQGENPEHDSSYTQMERARNFADNLRFLVTPNSLHELVQIAYKLALIQLRKAGIMIDSQTIAEAFNVPNYGTIDGATVIERYNREQEMKLEEMAKMKAVAEAIGLAPPGGAGGGPPGAPKPGGGSPEGRPASFTAPPSIASKDGGTRSTIRSSK